MVVYDVDLSKPGAPSEGFTAGFNGTIATVLVGSNKEEFKIPVDHPKHIDLFAKAFDGLFKEAEHKMMELPEEDPSAFGIFLQWLYRGLGESDLSKSSIQLSTWISALLMADKWCLNQLCLNLAKHVYNLLHVGLIVKRTIQADAATAVYCLLAGHPFRYIFVHAAHFCTGSIWPNNLFLRLEEKTPSFFVEYARYSIIVSEVQKQNSIAWDAQGHNMLREATAHQVERFLMPLLFQELPFPDLFASLVNLCKDPGKRREYVRAFLRM